MNLTQLNIDNLTQLWGLGGEAGGCYLATKEYTLSQVAEAEWPNKLWFRNLPDGQLLEKIFHELNMEGVSIALWDRQIPAGDALLKAYGFSVKNELTGMSFPLDRLVNTSNRLRICRVENGSDAKMWSELFQLAFNYLIHPETIRKTLDKIHYFIGFYEDEPIGTAVLYQHEPKIAGIHSMGVIPEHRRKGFAQDLLMHILHQARQKGAEYATLQASDMGKGLYQKVGFSEDFQLINYIR